MILKSFQVRRTDELLDSKASSIWPDLLAITANVRFWANCAGGFFRKS
jgi:hypothetical protein